MVKEALALTKAGNFTGAVDTAFTAGYMAACAGSFLDQGIRTNITRNELARERCNKWWADWT